MGLLKSFELWDALNFFIVISIYDAVSRNKEITTWDIAKNYFKGEIKQNLSETKIDDFISRKGTTIRFRIKAMAKQGFVDIVKTNGKYKFNLNDDKVLICKHIFPKRNKKSDCILIKKNDGKWIAYEL